MGFLQITKTWLHIEKPDIEPSVTVYLRIYSCLANPTIIFMAIYELCQGRELEILRNIVT